MCVGDVENSSEVAVLTAGKRSEFTDIPIICIDCAKEFVWTAGEQEFYRDKQLQNPPKRCKSCKKLKNDRLAAVENAWRTGKRQRIEVTAKCAECAEVTTVPFFPSQGRPVYCRSCFLKIEADIKRIAA